MQQDKDHDYGINIKFKSDRDKKGEYKLIVKNASNGAKNFPRNNKVKQKFKSSFQNKKKVMPCLCSECIQEYRKWIKCQSPEEKIVDISQVTKIKISNKQEYFKKIGIIILKAIICSFITLTALNICWEFYNAISICLTNFAFYFVIPFLKFLIWSIGLIFLFIKSKFYEVEDINETRFEPNNSVEIGNIMENNPQD